MTRAETLAAIKTATCIGGEFEGCACQLVGQCHRCTVGWLLQEIEYLQQGLLAYRDLATPPRFIELTSKWRR